MAKPLPFWQPALWGCGQIAVQIFRDVPSLLLLFYMTQVLAIPAFMAGIAIFLPKLVWGALCDFGLGSILDRLPRPIRRRHFMLLGAVMAPVALILLFMPSTGTTAAERAVHVSLLLCLYMATFSTFSIPHLAIGTELSPDPNEQSKIMAWRTAFIGVGLLGGAGLAPFLVQHYGGGIAGYRSMSLVLGAICGTSIFLSFLGSSEPHRANPRSARGTAWSAALKNRPLVFLFLAYFFQLVGQGTAYATFAYVVTFKLAFHDPLQVLSLSVLITGVIFVLVQPVLVVIVRRWGTRRSFVVGSVLYAASLAWLPFGPTASLPSVILVSVGLGLTNSSTFQAVFTRLSAIITADTAASGDAQSRAGFFSSLFVVNDKIAFALGGTLLAGAILSLSDFVPGGTLAQPESALRGISFAFAGVPALANSVAILLMLLSPEPGDRRLQSHRPTRAYKPA